MTDRAQAPAPRLLCALCPGAHEPRDCPLTPEQVEAARVVLMLRGNLWGVMWNDDGRPVRYDPTGYYLTTSLDGILTRADRRPLWKKALVHLVDAFQRGLERGLERGFLTRAWLDAGLAGKAPRRPQALPVIESWADGA